MHNMLVLLAVLPTFALAEDRATVDVLESCLTAPAAGSDARDCIGVIATQCMAAPEGQTTVGMMQCALAEAEAWDVLLNRYYRQARALARDMDAGDRADFPEFAVRAATLLDAQRAWISFRDANCTAQYAQWGAGTMRQIIGADCQLEMTALRTISLYQYATMLR